MARLANLIMIALLVQACLILYGTSTDTSGNIYSLIVNPSGWESNWMVLSLLAVALFTTTSGIAAGTIFGFKTDFLLFGTTISGLLALLAVPLINLWQVAYMEFIAVFMPGCGAGVEFGCAQADLIVGVLFGPILIMVIWTVVDWWRGRDM